MIEILKPILKKLNSEFGSEYQVFTDRQKQGVRTPCFFVKILNTELDPQLGNLYYLRNLMSVTFLPKKEDLYVLENIRFRLLLAMRQIPTMFGVEGRNLQARIVDGGIVMTGRYDLLFEIVEDKEPFMRILNNEFFTDEKISLNDINKDLHPEYYKKPETEVKNTIEDLKNKGVDESLIDYIDLMREKNNNWRLK